MDWYGKAIRSATFFALTIIVSVDGFAQRPSSTARIARDPTLFSQLGWTQPTDPLRNNSPRATPPNSAPTLRQPAVTQSPTVDQRLTLAALEEMALSVHPALAEAAARVQAAQGRWLQSGLPFNPEIGYSGQQLGSGGLAEQHGIVLAKKFIRGGKLDLNRAVECEEIHLRTAELARQQQRVITDVRIAFYQVLAAGRHLDLARQLNQINAQALQAAETLVRVQEGSKVDVLQAQIELETAAAALHQAEFEFTAAWRRLATLVGQPDMPVQSLDGNLETSDAPLAFDDVWHQLEADSPELLLAQIAVEKACRQLRRQQVESVPDVDVEAILQHDNGTGGIDGNLQVTFPLRTVNRNQGGIQEASAQVIATRQALERKRLDLRSKLTEVFAQYETAVDQASHYRESILPKAAENLDLARRGYEAGEFSFIQVLTVQRTFAEKNSIYLKALSELWTRKLEIDGLLLKDSFRDE